MTALELVRDGEATYLPCPSCGERIVVSTEGTRWTVQSPRDIGERLVVQMASLAREELHVLLLNSRNRVVGQERLYQGNVAFAQVRIGELFREAVHRHVPRIVLVHNHPSGDPTPSPDDLHMTAEAIAAGRLLDIEVLDHLIVAGDGYVSLRDRGVAFAALR
jgi:DNA repair protein RadC